MDYNIYHWLQLEAVKAKARRELEKRKEEAIKEAERIKSKLLFHHWCIIKIVCVVCAVAEEASIAALREKKQSLLRELQQQIKTARAVSLFSLSLQTLNNVLSYWCIGQS